MRAVVSTSLETTAPATTGTKRAGRNCARRSFVDPCASSSQDDGGSDSDSGGSSSSDSDGGGAKRGGKRARKEESDFEAVRAAPSLFALCLSSRLCASCMLCMAVIASPSLLTN